MSNPCAARNEMKYALDKQEHSGDELGSGGDISFPECCSQQLQTTVSKQIYTVSLSTYTFLLLQSPETVSLSVESSQQLHVDSYNKGVEAGMHIAKSQLSYAVPGPKNMENRKKREARRKKRKETIRRMKEGQ